MARIMIIEDDEGMQKSLRRALVMAGYTTVEAPNGVIGLHLLKKEAVDLVITDIFIVSQCFKKPCAHLPSLGLSLAEIVRHVGVSTTGIARD